MAAAIQHKGKSIGTLVREARKRAGVTQLAISEATGISEAAISHIENDRREDVKWKTLVRIAGAVGCRVEVRFVPE